MAKSVEWDPSGSGNWYGANRWKGGVTLTDADTDIAVTVNGCTGTVTEADAALFAKVSSITLTGEVSCLAVSNTTAQDLTTAATITGDGTLLKLGNGSCWLTYVVKTEAEGKAGLKANYDVRDGLLAFPREPADEVYLKKMSVWKPGIFMSAGNVTHLAGGLWGDGIVSNDVSKTIRLDGGTEENPAIFSGTFVHHGYPTASYSKGVQYLTGTNSTAGKSLLLYGKGAIGVSKFGVKEGASSWGTGSVQFRGTAKVIYLGEGENTTKEFSYGASATSGTIDAGEHGGLTVSGNLSIVQDNNKMHLLYLTGNGDNYMNSVLSSGWVGTDERALTPYVVKQGPGSWTFMNNQPKRLHGTFAIEEGTLGFTSIAEAGTDCALGDATILHSPYYGDRDDSKAVPYAYLLGNGSADVTSPTLATMAYKGTSAGSVTTRPIALKGAGRLSSDQTPLSWAGVTTVDGSEGTLVLGGEASGSVVSCVTNGPGTVSVVKDGTGLWKISGDNDFSGRLAANGGQLILSGTNYEWYCLSIIETWWAATNAAGAAIDGDGYRFALTQFALYDEDGTNLALDLPHNKRADGKVALLAPGEAAMRSYPYRVFGSTAEKRAQYALTNLFTSTISTCSISNTRKDGTEEELSDGKSDLSIGGATYNMNSTSNWVRIAVRLPKNAKSVMRYDLRAAGSYPNGSSSTSRIPRSWRLEGSVDGVNWDVLHEVISNTYDKVVTGGSNHWFSDNKVDTKHDPSGSYGPLETALDGLLRPTAVASVSAAEGATLESTEPLAANGLAYDGAKGGGTIDGFAFSANATLDLSNVALTGEWPLHLPITLKNSTGYADREWDVSVDGTSKRGLYATVSENGIDVWKRGAVLIVR